MSSFDKTWEEQVHKKPLFEDRWVPKSKEYNFQVKVEMKSVKVTENGELIITLPKKTTVFSYLNHNFLNVNWRVERTIDEKVDDFFGLQTRKELSEYFGVGYDFLDHMVDFRTLEWTMIKKEHLIEVNDKVVISDPEQIPHIKYDEYKKLSEKEKLECVLLYRIELPGNKKEYHFAKIKEAKNGIVESADKKYITVSLGKMENCLVFSMDNNIMVSEYIKSLIPYQQHAKEMNEAFGGKARCEVHREK